MEKREYSKAIANVIKEHLTSENIRFLFDEETGSFTFFLTSTQESMLKKLNYTIIVHKDSYVVYTYLPIGADVTDKEISSNICEFICSVNISVLIGSFEFDTITGEICFKSYMNCGNNNPDDITIAESIVGPALMIEKYEKTFIDIIFRHKSANDEYSVHNFSQFKAMLKNIISRYRSEDVSEDAECSDFDDDEAEEEGGDI